MTTEKKPTTTPTSLGKRSGPRTPAGKARAGRNAVRHGLAAKLHDATVPSDQIERLANAIRDDDDDPAIVEQARIIARNELLLRTIAAQRLFIVERLRDPKSLALSKRRGPLQTGWARFRESKLADKEIKRELPRLLQKYKDVIGPDAARLRYDPLGLIAFVEDPSPAKQRRLMKRAREHIEAEERDEHKALKEGVRDLIRLDRYERQAWSRQKRAIYELLSLQSGGGRWQLRTRAGMRVPRVLPRCVISG